MPTVVRSRMVGAAPQRLWDLVSDPERLPEWWPGVQRVEEASRSRWTTVLGTPRGKSVRADYTLVRAEQPWRLVWRHEVEQSPFERLLRGSETEVELEAAPQGTLVRLTARRRMRGLARLGALQVRRATRRQLDAALSGLQNLASGRDR